MISGGIKILVTLGPNSLNEDVVRSIDKESIYLFRINMSHTSLDKLEESIINIKKYTDTPICIDSEGAQIRSGEMENGCVDFIENELVKINSKRIVGDKNNIYFTPDYISEHLDVGDIIKIDFNSTQIQVTEKHSNYCNAIVKIGGRVGSNKATDVNKDIELNSITPKDLEAIKIGKKYDIKHFSLSFASSEENVNQMRELVGKDSVLISKIESLKGLYNLEGILRTSDEILIDRGDLSRQVSLEKIPFLQRRIISMAKSRGIPVFVATNLLESMIQEKEPTRAEINDVVSTILMGADGLVLAAETAIGSHPRMVVEMVNKLIRQTNQWTPNSSISDILNNTIKKNEYIDIKVLK